MLKNYLKIALRNFWKNKTSSVINIIGLTIGLTCCLLIALYITHELSYDNFEKKGDRIVRVIMEYRFGGSAESNKGNFTSVRVAPVFKRTFPEVESAVRMTQNERVVGYQDKLITEKRFMYADPAFFDLFSLKLLQGDPHRVLSAPHDLVVTTSTSKKYFGNENPVGKAFHISGDSNLYKITGVMEDCPSNSQIKFDFLASFSSLGIPEDWEKTYWDANYTTYLLLRNENAILSLQGKLSVFMKKEMQGQGATVNFYLEPFDKIHLHSAYDGFEPNNSIAYIYILAAIALLILFIACATFINLSTARSIERAKEVGVRKVIGAEKKQLFWQFIGESFLVCLLTSLLSLLVASLLLPFFNQLCQKQLQTASLLSPLFVSLSLALAICVSLIAGSYPALILSGFQPIKVLKGSFKSLGLGQGLRRSLIVFQFAITVFLIISTLVMQRQLYFIQHKKLGYDREHVLILPVNNTVIDHIDLIKQQFRQNADVLSISCCHRSPVEGGGGYNMRSEQMTDNQQIAVVGNPGDEDFVRTVGLQLIAGQNFTLSEKKQANDTDVKKVLYHFILNESAARELGWTPQEAIGKRMYLGDNRPGYVKGVIKDFNFKSLREPVKAYVLFPEHWSRELLVKLTGQHLPLTINFLESKWKELIPDRPFEYRFMDDDYNNLYDGEIRLGKVMNLFSSIAIVLACLGLFGLSSFVAQQRLKEIGIRKVLGASVGNLVFVLYKDFFRLSLIAIALASPIAWWVMARWLQGFAYRAEIGWPIYIAAAVLTILLSMSTVCLHAVRVGLANPVKSLRSE